MLPHITNAHCLRRVVVIRVHIMHVPLFVTITTRVVSVCFILFSAFRSGELLRSLLNNSDPGVRPNVDGKYNARWNMLSP